jgi:hypothetical protein
MPHTFDPHQKPKALEFYSFFQPAIEAMSQMPALNAQGNRPLQMSFEEHLRTLVFFHLEEHHSAQHLLQVLEQDDFAKCAIAPKNGIKKSSFSEATNSRGLEQFMHVYQNLQAQASKLLPKQNPELGNLVGIDGSLIDATLSMNWADFRKKSKKAKVHVGFDLNQAIPRKVYLTGGNGDERPFASLILSDNQTGVMDRGYQSHKRFDQWQRDGTLFMCRIKAGTKKTIIKKNSIATDSIVFFDAIVILGTTEINQTQEPLRLVGYEVDRVKYWIATDRYDLTPEQIAAAYKLRWNIENFFAWWKRHLKVYHLIARSKHGLMVQILAGLITYLLLAIYCHRQFNERVSIKRVRQLRITIQNELRAGIFDKPPDSNFKEQQLQRVDAKT